MGIWVGVSGICTGVCYEPNSPSKVYKYLYMQLHRK